MTLEPGVCEKITVSGIIKGLTGASQIKQLNSEYQEKQFVMIPGFLDNFLATEIRRMVSETKGTIQYATEEHSDSKGLIFSDNPNLNEFVNSLMNQPAVLDFLRRVTGKDCIGSFSGYIYRTSAADDRALGWHQDLTEHRLSALSINLSQSPYTGGEFLLREKNSKKEILRKSNTGPGDLILTNLTPDLEHCTTKPTGETTRLTLAGWACEYPKNTDSKLY